jgi:hypothetical protein
MRKITSAVAGALIMAGTVAVSAAPAAAAVTPQCTAIVNTLNNLAAQASQISLINAPLYLIGFGPVPPYLAGLNAAAGSFSDQASVGNFCPASDTTGTNQVQDAYAAELGVLMSKQSIFDSIPGLEGAIVNAHGNMQNALEYDAPGTYLQAFGE